jgi:hypothetical protein
LLQPTFKQISLTQAPSQTHLFTVGIFGGIFGAISSEVLLLLLYGPELPTSVKDRARENYGLKIVGSVVCGLLLPRIAFSLDASNFSIWNHYAALSSEQTF